ncbi:MAG: alpha/beta hydrolase domain-containing protein [Acidobacteriota bacterium]
MMFLIRKRCRRVLLGLTLVLVPALGFAEVTRIEIVSRQDVLGGQAFGSVGAYEKISGKVYFAVDPSNVHNAIVADLDKAPRNARGRVEFSADLFIIKPKDPSRGNGVLLFDVLNRGGKALLGVFNRATRSADPTTAAEFGDGYLLRQGYTLVAVGWQFDVSGAGLMGLQAPIATDSGRPITGWVRMWVIPAKAARSMEYVNSYNTRAYPPRDLQQPDARLTEREGIVAPAHLVDREDWRFAREENGQVVPDPNSIWLKTGLRAGQTYEVAYQAEHPPVAGLGLAAIRDVASALRYGRDPVAPGRYAYLFGASQTGRLIRQIVYEGFTIDEQGRRAFDAALVQTGATGLGSFNQRFAQPGELGSFTQTNFPILYTTTTDPVTGRRDGLGARIAAGLEPKMFLIDTSSEYWDRGRAAALRHVSLDGRTDIEDAPNLRVYHLSGTQHGAGSLPPADGGGQFKTNTNDYRWAQRGLLAALDAWVRQNTEPPASQHPRLRDGSLVAQRDMTFPAIPGVQWPTSVPGGFRGDVPFPYSALPFLVPAGDVDGNDIGGIRLPEQAVPLATLTGWQFRSEKLGAPRTLIAMAGAYIPFPATRAEREQSKDPRLSIAERYASREDYLRLIQEAGVRLAQQRYVLPEDVAAMTEQAGKHWDWRMTPPTPGAVK